MKMKTVLSVLILFFFGIEYIISQPYPPGNISVKFDSLSKEQLAPGSDNFQVKWADDNHQYAAWGGYKAENPVQFEGKSWGIICVDSILYVDHN